jgi:hypothetical protein
VLIGDASSKKEKAAMAEDAEFAKAVDLVLGGKTDDGVKALEAFKTGHPKSRSLDKVQQALEETKGLAALKSGDAIPAPASVAASGSAVLAGSPKADVPKPDAPAASAAPAAK